MRERNTDHVTSSCTSSAVWLSGFWTSVHIPDGSPGISLSAPQRALGTESANAERFTLMRLVVGRQQQRPRSVARSLLLRRTPDMLPVLGGPMKRVNIEATTRDVKEQRVHRRSALAKLGLLGIAAYVAPSLMTLSDAQARTRSRSRSKNRSRSRDSNQRRREGRSRSRG
jgi:hypothetical protein